MWYRIAALSATSTATTSSSRPSKNRRLFLSSDDWIERNSAGRGLGFQQDPAAAKVSEQTGSDRLENVAVLGKSTSHHEFPVIVLISLV